MAITRVKTQITLRPSSIRQPGRRLAIVITHSDPALGFASPTCVGLAFVEDDPRFQQAFKLTAAKVRERS